MKVLVAVASRHNATRGIAEAIADELRASGLEVHLHDADRSIDPKGYDAVILGSGVYMGRWLPEAKRFITQHGPTLRTIPVWIFSSGPLGEDDPKPHGDPEDVPKLMETTGAREHKVFAGRLDKSGLGLVERLIANAVHAPDGDFRDLGDVLDWARSIALSLESMQVNSSTGRERGG
jgi:menaquinone-dependent protoporphyrinogen oxidase